MTVAPALKTELFPLFLNKIVHPVPQREDMLNGNLGFSGSNPVIQVAGAQRIIESDPRELFTSGNFATVPTM